MKKYKECKCDEEYWEEIVVQNDESYEGKTVLYFHCANCGVDFQVVNFETGKEMYYNSKYEINLSPKND